MLIEFTIVRWIYSGDYRAGVTLCSIPNQTGKPRIADGTLASATEE